VKEEILSTKPHTRGHPLSGIQVTWEAAFTPGSFRSLSTPQKRPRRQRPFRNRQFRHFCGEHVEDRGYGVACLIHAHREYTVVDGSFVQNDCPLKKNHDEKDGEQALLKWVSEARSP